MPPVSFSRCKRLVPVLLVCLAVSVPGAFAENPRFAEVQKKLDTGGSFYMYVDVKDQLRLLFDELKAVAEESEDEDDAFIAAVAESVLESLGVFDITDLGLSITESGEMHRRKAYVAVPNTSAGLLAITGGDPHEFDTLRYAPPATALFESFDFDFEKLYELVRKVVSETSEVDGLANPDEQVHVFDKQIAEWREDFGVDVEELIRSLSGTIALVAEFHPTEKFQVPESGEPPFEIPLPQLTFLIGCKDAQLYETLSGLVGANEVKVPQANGKELRRTPIQIPVPDLNITPQIVFDGTYLMLTSHGEFLDRMLESANGGENLSSDANYKKLVADMPKKGNDLAYVSPRLGEVLESVGEEMKKTMGEEEAESIDWILESLLEESPFTEGMAAVRANEEGGMYWVAASPADLGIFTDLRKIVPYLALLGVLEDEEEEESQEVPSEEAGVEWTEESSGAGSTEIEEVIVEEVPEQGGTTESP